MKKMKLTKIFVLILSLALLIGSAVCVAASAEDEGEYTIKSVNIAHGDKIRVLIAVDAPVERAEDITVNYTFNGAEYTATYWKNVAIYAESGDDTLYPVYYTVGIAAKDMGEDVIARIGDSAATKNISVATYLYQRLYKDGIINATEGKDLNKKNFYVDMLEYGAKAQTVLWNALAENADNQRPLVTGYGWFSITDGTVNGSDGGVFKGDGELVYTGSNADFVGWNVTVDGDTTLMYAPTTIPGGTFCAITPVFSTTMTNFEGAEVGAGWSYVGKDGYADESGKYPDSADSAEKVVGGDLPSMIYLYHGSSGKNLSVGSHVTVEQEANGNKYLHYVSRGQENMQSGADTRAIGLRFDSSVAPTEDQNLSIVEFDVKFISANNSVDTCLNFTTYNSAGKTVGSFYGYRAGTGYWQLRHQVAATETSSAVNTYYSIAPGNQWVHIRVEYYSDAKTYYFYADDMLVAVMDNSRNTAVNEGGIGRVAFSTNAKYTGDAYIDNLSFSYAQTTVPSHYYVGFDAAIKTPVTKSYTVNNETATDFNVTNSVSNSYDFGGGITIANSAVTYVCEQDVRFLTDENGKSYINIYSNRRIHTKDRGYTFSMAPTLVQNDKVTTMTTKVFEFDFKMDSTVVLNDGSTVGMPATPLQWNFGGDKTIRYSFFTRKGNNYVAPNGTVLCAMDEWVTIRVIYYGADVTGEGGVIQFWAKPLDGDTFVHIDTITDADTKRTDSANYTEDGVKKYYDLSTIKELKQISLTSLNSEATAGGISYCIDNVTAYYTNIPYVAQE